MSDHELPKYASAKRAFQQIHSSRLEGRIQEWVGRTLTLHLQERLAYRAHNEKNPPPQSGRGFVQFIQMRQAVTCALQ